MKTIKGNHGGRGGARPGAGRKPGSASLKTREIANRAAIEGITPLEYMLAMMRKQAPAGADPSTQLRYDALRFEAAKAAAPYIHPRLATRSPDLEFARCGASLADYGRAVIDAMGKGEIGVDDAATAMQALVAQSRIMEVDELERRVQALEAKTHP